MGKRKRTKKAKNLVEIVDKDFDFKPNYSQCSESKFCKHKENPFPIKIGDRVITPLSLKWTSIDKIAFYDVLIQLDDGSAPKMYDNGWGGMIINIPINDFDTIQSRQTAEILMRRVYAICEKSRVAIGCIGGHGRTGYMIAGIIGLFEPEIADPISVLRQRVGCQEMIETIGQAEDVFDICGAKLPEKYNIELRAVGITGNFGNSWGMEWFKNKGFSPNSAHKVSTVIYNPSEVEVDDGSAIMGDEEELECTGCGYINCICASHYVPVGDDDPADNPARQAEGDMI